MSENSPLHKLLVFESKELKHFFKKASVEASGTPQDVADRREKSVNSFVRKYFPFPSRCVKGRIVDSFGGRSNSIDCILLSPSHPYTELGGSLPSVILADGVDVAIEVKADINNVAELQRALAQIASVKHLKRRRHGMIDVKNKLTADQKETLFRLPAVIYSEHAHSDPHFMLDRIATYYEKKQLIHTQQFDLLVVNGERVVFNGGPDMLFGPITGVEAPRGLYFADLKDEAISVMLLFLIKVPKSEPLISGSVLGPYLHFDLKRLGTFHEINLRLKLLDERGAKQRLTSE